MPAPSAREYLGADATQTELAPGQSARIALQLHEPEPRRGRVFVRLPLVVSRIANKGMHARKSRARLLHPVEFANRARRAIPHRVAQGISLVNAAARHDTSRGNPRPPLRDHVAKSVRRYLRDLDGCDADDLYDIVLREIEIPLFAEVLRHCEGNQSRAAAMLGIHRATLRKKLKDYGLT